jgi:hypothetical protein
MKNSHLITPMVLLAGCGVEGQTEGRRHHDVKVNVHSRISCQPAMSRQVPQIITPATASTPTTIRSAASGAPSDILSMNSQPSAPGWCRVVEIQQQTLLTQYSPPWSVLSYEGVLLHRGTSAAPKLLCWSFSDDYRQ